MKPSRKRATDIAFRALGDPTRRAILLLLRNRAECLAGEVAAKFPRISRPAVSRHLRLLREARLVRAREIGRENYYRLAPETLARMQREWFAQFGAVWDASLAALKRQVESSAPSSRSAKRRKRTVRF